MMLTPGCEGGTFLRLKNTTNPDETFQVTKLGGYLVRWMYKFLCLCSLKCLIFQFYALVWNERFVSYVYARLHYVTVMKICRQCYLL